jgi:hypothetical protein
LTDRLNPTIAEEVDQSYREELPPCKDFTPVNIYGKLLRIVAKVSGRIFIGPELCRSEKYIDTASKWLMAGNLPVIRAFWRCGQRIRGDGSFMLVNALLCRGHGELIY